MITFLPSSDFETSARILDDKRLGAQRYEAWSIVKWLRNPEDYPHLVRAGYCRMWRGYVPALVRYTNAMLREWARRGKNNKELRPEDPGRGLEEVGSIKDVDMPPWMGCDDLHSYHRQALMAKLPQHYGKFGWDETGEEYNGSYPWPICLDDEEIGGWDAGSWVLRWPKSLKLDPVPIFVSRDSLRSAVSRRKITTAPPKTKVRNSRNRTTGNKSSQDKQVMAATKRRTAKHNVSKTNGNKRKAAGRQPVRRSLRLSKMRTSREG
mmetsp:Transcript_2523/g.6585  ORF Transcript_2523/g.6585 Transcript_2523/m.6585 type:complete len:265 (-) Transcript_2523:177-971(-)|eukprot:CAMPEP_0113528568 /NCGR_PEP_ID=MMETSP0015_2-20120614/1916_1 /TAXON_ID=2838 /ORGANISM="Odontella" /LENGTH=264 /DNA_ID=CAMNT_0000427113 /DNA_START=166 /DNA_END=960 /DNA_ORIENTATION=- /assembly_acc=CAM_ASM_000160